MNATYKLELNSKPNKDGRYTIFLRRILNRKIRRIKTGITVYLGQFDKEAEYGKWIVKHPGKRKLNTELDDLLYKARTNESAIFSTTGQWTLGAFVEKMLVDAESNSVGYQRNLKSRLGVFVKFAGRDIPLSAINIDLLDQFKRHLQAEGKMSGTMHTYFNRIKRLTLEALKLELITKDPFRYFVMPEEKPAPRLKLSDAQVQALESVEISEQRTDALGRSYDSGIWLFRAKWLYLFAYQMGGIRSRDVLQLRWSNLVGETGKERLEYQMSKTGEFMSTKLTRKAKEIIELFKTDESKPNDYLFSVLPSTSSYASYATHEQKRKMPRELAVKLFNDIASAQAQINGELKILAKKAGIVERLTFHTARHSFADKARRKMKESKNVSIDDIRQALGHTSFETTQRYLNSFDKESLDSAMDAIWGEE